MALDDTHSYKKKSIIPERQSVKLLLLKMQEHTCTKYKTLKPLARGGVYLVHAPLHRTDKQIINHKISSDNERVK